MEEQSALRLNGSHNGASSNDSVEIEWEQNDSHMPESPDSELEHLVDVSQDHVDKVKKLVENIRMVDDSNTLYYLCFQLLRLGGLSAEIPRFVVFGQQSMGKTTLLDYIMGGPIGYRSTDTGTKQPVIIMLKPSTSQKVECSLDGKKMDISQLQHDMAARMVAVGDAILSEELLVEISIPGGVHAVFVDLPGIKDDSKTGADVTRSVVRNYVSFNPNDLYILVKKASDDPANWPWSLREFILSPHPVGLGLTGRQTVVVGTRAKEFLMNEKSDIGSQSELLIRVKKRAVMDSEKEPLPLHLMELFSLPLELKDSADFLKKKDVMQQQIRDGNMEVMSLIHSFENNLGQNRGTLLEFFDVKKFKVVLNGKFQELLQSQLIELEKKLVKKRFSLKDMINNLETKAIGTTPENCRENIRIFVRELHRIICQLMTGNYPIMMLPQDGKLFMQQFGGSVQDNLDEGDLLAKEIFSSRDNYDNFFFEKMKLNEAREIATIKEQVKRKKEAKEASQKLLSKLHQGSPVRFHNTKDTLSAFFGTIDSKPVSKASPDHPHTEASSGHPNSTASAAQTNAATNSQSHSSKFSVPFLNSSRKTKKNDESVTCLVNFYGRDISNNMIVEKKMLDVEQLIPLVSPSEKQLNAEKFVEFKCWYRTFRSDGWLGLLQGIVTAVEPAKSVSPDRTSATVPGSSHTSPTTNNTLRDALSVLTQQEGHRISKFEATIKPIANKWPGENHGNAVTVSTEQLFIDSLQEKGVGTYVSADYEEEQLTKYSISRLSQVKDTKLLNQLSITYLSNWMKYHISALEPSQQFSDQIILQMMRSVHNVMDKTDWEPLVADLLQANIRDGFLNLSKLVCCAGTCAIKRIFSAALVETRRRIEDGVTRPGLSMLLESPQFTQDASFLLDEFCRLKAIECNRAMQETIFEQTHAIRFEIIEDLFEGCSQYEEKFLGTDRMREVITKLREAMDTRRQRLSSTEQIFKLDSSNPAYTVIFNEVRMQFWVAKMLLSGPLASKLYLYYIKNVIDSSSHLASRGEFKSVVESELEVALYSALTSEKNMSDEYVPRTDSDLLGYYGIDCDIDITKQRIDAGKRTLQYVQLALEAIVRLRHQMERHSGVDFLMKLDIRPTHKAAAAGPAGRAR